MWALLCRLRGHRIVHDECRLCRRGYACCRTLCRPCTSTGWCWVCDTTFRLTDTDEPFEHCACTVDPDRMPW